MLANAAPRATEAPSANAPGGGGVGGVAATVASPSDFFFFFAFDFFFERGGMFCRVTLETGLIVRLGVLRVSSLS